MEGRWIAAASSREGSAMLVHGADLFVADFGGAGEPLVFLHGFLFDGRQYAAQVEALREDHRCITIDFRGQGRSGPTRGGFQIEQQAADVLEVLRQLELDGVHLVGLSMGGFVAMRLAARTPERIRSLTLVNTSAAPHARSKFPKQLALAGVARVTGVSPAPILAGIESEMYGEAFRHDPATAAVRDEWRARWARADRVALVGTLLGFMIRPDMRPELPGITAQTLIIAGAADASLPPRYSHEMHELIPGARLVEIPGAGHSSPVEAPEQVTQALREFLASTRT
jgi:pimeloyl-ACP methyl ester carboxylesterase